MLDFRKALLALSVAGLGLVGTANAQVQPPTCNAGGGLTNFVAAEGTTEQLPVLMIGCNTNGVVTGVVSFQITTNAPLANQLKAGSTSSYDVVVSDNAGDTASAVTETGPNTLVVTFNSLAATSPTISIGNIRVNASTAPVNSTISATVAASGAIISTQPSTYGGFVTKSISTVVVDAGGNVLNPSSCGVTKSTLITLDNITVTEGFQDSLKTLAEVNGTPVGPVAALQGTTLAVTLTNLDPGVNYYVPATITANAGTLVVTAVTGPGSTTAATPVAEPTVPASGVTFILLTSASPTVYYQVTTSGGAANTDNFTIFVQALVPSVSAVTSFATSPVGASVVLVGATAPAYPGYSGGITYTSTVLAGNTTNGILTPCSTTLLFPYVTNASGFDTGIAIANASTLPAGVAGISAATGACTLTFYGTGAATASPVSVTYGTVATGTVGTPIAMGGSSTAAAGLTGYAVAVCNFVGAHGYAFITDSLGSGSGVAANYLAVILSSGADGYSPAPGATPAAPVITPTN
jgi:hypothetical protein